MVLLCFFSELWFELRDAKNVKRNHRHTFATNALNNGILIEYVSKLLDHSDIGITQIYAKVISEELDKAVE